MFLTGLLLSSVIGLSLLYPRVIDNRFGFILMLPVITYTAYFYIEWQFLSLFHLSLVVLGGVFVGLGSLIAGLPISAPQPRQFIFNAIRGLKHLKHHKDYLFFQLGITFYEEFIWRVFLISTLVLILPAWIAICISSVLFWAVHEENRPIGWHSLEFFIFAILQGIAYLLTDSVLFVWVIHLTRNVFILSALYHEEYQSS